MIQRELTLVPPGDNGAIVELKYRLGQLREQHLGDVTGAIDMLSRHPRPRGRRTRARARRSSGGSATRRNQLVAAAILEPIYEQPEEWARLVDVHEIQLRARERCSRSA